MENKISKEKILIITTILVVSLVLIGIGYAFFTASNPEGSTAQIISKSGRMLINYNDGTDNIMPVTNIQPSNNILVDKTFTLTGINTTASNGLSMPYVISIEYQNTFKSNDLVNDAELEYYIKRMDTNENISCILKGFGLVNEHLVQQQGLPTSQVGYVVGYIDDWSGNTSTQELAYGEFKSSTEEQVLTLNLRMMFRDTGYNQDYNKGATFNGKLVVTAPETSTFATDTWEEIANNVKSGNASKYRVGSEKEVEIAGQNFTVRVANNTTPEECTREDFSQTACGFVVEFVDILKTGPMNSTDKTNVGGWPATEARELANGVYFNYLPSDLQKVITDTKVISGHGRDDKNNKRTDGNWESTDKLYLLSAHEVYEDGTSNQVSSKDTAWNNTRQLDYYKARNVNADGHWSSAMKVYGINERDVWWLRTANSDYTDVFLTVYSNGFWWYGSANLANGFAPAFRIGENVNNV